MEYCPYCHEYYDDDNDTQPCCPGCGYPLTFEDGDGELIPPGLGLDLDEELDRNLPI